MQDLFEWAAGSVPGRDHRHAFKNSHDAFHIEASPSLLVAVVCDGCGSGEHSEVGAKLGARIVAKQVLRWFQNEPHVFRVDTINLGLGKVRRSVLAQFQLLTDAMAGSFSEIVGDYFLATILGAIVTREDAFVFGAGDGVYWVNGQKNEIRAKDNKPPYLCYGIVETDGTAPLLEPYHMLRTKDLEGLVLGTDGAMDLAAAAEMRVPGKEDLIGPVGQFLEGRYFRNPFAIKHRLNLINRDYVAVDYERKALREEHGPLSDDTTLLIVRRRR